MKIGPMTMRMEHMLKGIVCSALAAATLLLAPMAAAGDGSSGAEECRLHDKLSTTRLLRRTSLALLGRIPTMDEYGQVSGKDADGPELEAVIDAWLETDDYRETMRRYHMELLWVNPDGANIMDGGHTMFPTSTQGGPNDVWWLPATQRAKAYRGGDGQGYCQNRPQTDIDPNYVLGTTPVCEQMGQYCREGYVDVLPYFADDPNNTIKVCAFEAQTIDTYVQPDGVNWHNSGTLGSCDDRQSRPHQVCGCGPNLRWCLMDRDYDESDKIYAAMHEQFLRLVDDFTTGDVAYHEMLTTKDTYSAGILDHYFKWQAHQNNYQSVYNRSGPNDAPLPADPDWNDETWYKATRSGQHAGILTQPGFLLRYQTARARANRFRIAFLGQYFVPPTGDDTVGCSDDAPDLTQRCTCRGCHATLEPLASYFGAFAEAGAALISHYDKEAIDQLDCADQVLPGNNGLCNRFYKRIDTANGQVYRRNSLEFADDHPEYYTRHDDGPAQLVLDEAMKPFGSADYSVLSWATTRNLFAFLMHRELDVEGVDATEKELLDELALGFESGGFRFKQLVRDIVLTSTFRRMP